jgi:hypothetical protein
VRDGEAGVALRIDKAIAPGWSIDEARRFGAVALSKVNGVVIIAVRGARSPLDPVDGPKVVGAIDALVFRTGARGAELVQVDDREFLPMRQAR